MVQPLILFVDGNGGFMGPVGLLPSYRRGLHHIRTQSVRTTI